MVKIMFISLGCDKNSVDTEFMLGQLRDAGYSITNSEEEADVIVINTCAFIEDAQEESVQTILEMAEYKKSGSLSKLIVAGCLAQRYKEQIVQEIPEVDAVVGTTAIDKIVEAINDGGNFIMDADRLPLPETARVSTTGGYFEYLKIAEGCDKHCTYCRIPSLRGKYRSIPMERLIEEARFLAEGGTKELCLIAQETTVYGTDIYGKKCLPELINKISEIEGVQWIRILYCYPEEIDDELIECIATNPKVCHYLDMPVQHSSDSILKKMGRRTGRKDLDAIIKKLRKRIPDIALRTTLIAGFPGETDEDQADVLDFIEKSRFTRLGCFTYSKEDGTAAARMKEQVPKRTKVKRQKEIMLLQQKISADFSASCIGRELSVIIEGKLPEEDIWIGRSYMDAPGIDGYVFVSSPDSYLSGDIVKVKVVKAEAYDLIAEAIIE